MIKGWYRGILTIITTLVLFFTQVGGSAALAAAGVTPFGPERFAHAHATYVITTKSRYYRQIWQSAISAWNKTGAFHFKAGTKRDAQIDLETASKSQAARLGEDVGLTEYTAQNDYLTKVTAMLNPSLLQTYGYSHSDDLHVAEHELGHTMGLAHNPAKQSVMYYRNRAVGIQKVDIEGVQLRYRTPAGQSAK
ncbi:matrixin family metalloprotease [Levilactobacillus yiduensis]|uniref:matrixin family metalloprotease n=1 Tax=Levilactobacillus yiduensis TaxID=2953880 RepID=UPI000EF352C2|nr:matrixin family metalloprotease [Levilactobacillus yiduensis]AYM03260.1 Zn-dependent protease [Levilactobacillus brevis]